MKGHLGSCPAQQSESKLADRRDHQVHSHGSPRFVSGRFGLQNLHTVFCQCLWLCRSSLLLLGKFKDGETSLKAVNVGGGPSRTVIRLQVRVSCSFLVQQETLERRETIIKAFVEWEYESRLLKRGVFRGKCWYISGREGPMNHCADMSKQQINLYLC